MNTGTTLKEAYVRGDPSAQFLEWSTGQLLHRAVQQAGDRAALIVPATADGKRERRWTYRELQSDSQRVAYALLKDFAPGDRVATWAAGSANFVMLQLGAALAGVVLVTLNPANRAAELQYMLNQSQARGLFLDRTFRQMDNVTVLNSVRSSVPLLETVIYMDEWEGFLAQANTRELPAVRHDESALILFTSGSTGKPKAAVLSHEGMVNASALTARQLSMRPGDVWLNVLPMFHIGGTGTMTLGCLSTMGTQVLLAEFNVDTMLDALARYRVNMTMAVPTMLIGMLQSPKLPSTDLSALQLIVAGGTAVAPDLVRRVKQAMGAEVATLMGQTEASGAMFSTRRGDSEDQVTLSVGCPLPLTEAKIVATSDGRTQPIGEIGEMCIRSRRVMREYFGMPEKTRETLDADGWLHTGDLGYMRPDGYLQVTGRLKEMIIRGGENIYPREIEDVLIEHADVAQVAVFGVPDEKWGEQVAAAVIPRPGKTLDFDALTRFLQERIARHKVPKLWRVVDGFPLNASGKIQKFVLQEQFGREAGR
ncbi:MAG: AMP-binding protein [Steroidobacteraceae bacterium]